jgi:acetyl-CoA carboxylase biotin carboxyl carrier protein
MSFFVESPVVGTVWKIEVGVGDTVEVGDTVMILESMKMEIPVEADMAGEITAIDVAEGEAVAEDQVLARID